MSSLTPQQAASILAVLNTPPVTGTVEIRREGDQIILPPNMTYDEGITWLTRKKKEDETWIEIDEVIEGFAYDAANAFNLAVREMFGMKSMDPWRAQSQNVPVNAEGDTINVFLGAMEVPGLDGKIKIMADSDWSISIHFNIRHKDRDKADRLMALARKLVRESSIYKGKAFKLGWKSATFFAPAGFADPEFIKTGIRGQLQVNEETLELIQSSVWTPIQHAQLCREFKIPLKRGILAEGPYGTGKTMFSAETATIAEQHGWTFIYLLDIRRLAQAYQAARKYAPAVLFAEDVDILVSDRDDDIPESVRNTLDGVDTKGSEVIVVLTTNWLEKMPKSILRPGRLDTVIPFRAPNPQTVMRLVRQYAGSLLASDVDLTVPSRILNGQIPAVIREVVERSKLHAISRIAPAPGDACPELILTGDDLSHAAAGMKQHLDLLNREKTEGPSPMQQFGDSFGKALVLGAYAAKKGLSMEEILDTTFGSEIKDLEKLVAMPAVANGSGD